MLRLAVAEVPKLVGLIKIRIGDNKRTHLQMILSVGFIKDRIRKAAGHGDGSPKITIRIDTNEVSHNV